MSEEQLVLWIDACEKMLAWVKYKNARKGWRESKTLAEAILGKKKIKAIAVESRPKKPQIPSTGRTSNLPNQAREAMATAGMSAAGHPPRQP